MGNKHSFGKGCIPKQNKMARNVSMACAGIAGVLTTTLAFAQVPPSDTTPKTPEATQAVEQIIVTARKRDEKLIDVPISVLTYSEKELRSSGVSDMRSLSDSAGFSYQQSAGGSTVASGRAFGTIVFRGLQSTSGFPRENSGALFIDGIFISGGVSSVSTVGVQRVEVLKGPQNTYFGRSTFGGAVNFITKNPPITFGGEVNSAVTARGSADTDLTVGGPLGSEALRGSVTVVSHVKAAQYKATDGGDLGAEKSTSISGTLYATPTTNLWLRARAHYQQDDDSSAAIGYLRGDVYGVGSCTGQTFAGRTTAGVAVNWTPTVPYFCGTIPSMNQVGLQNALNANTTIPAIAFNPFVNNSLGNAVLGGAPQLTHTGLRRDVTRVSFQGGYDLPYNAALAFSAGYNKANSTTIWDLDRSGTQNFINALPVLTSDATYDVRVTSDPAERIRGLFGLSYFTSKFKLQQIDYNIVFGTPPTASASSYTDDKATVPAVYGAVDFDIMKNLTLSVEARFQKDKSTTTTLAGVQYSQEFSNTLPRAILQFKPNADTNLYVSYSKGIQPTSFNSNFVNANPAQRAYISSVVPGADIFAPQPKLDNVEIGIKQNLLNNRVQYSLSAYQLKWHDQLTLAALFNTPACVAAGTFNTPACPLGANGATVLLPNQAEIKGVEFSVIAALTPQWSVGLNADFKDAKWKSYYDSAQGGFTGGATRFDGNKLPRIPAVSGTLNSTYNASLGGGWSWYARGDVNYTGAQWESSLNLAKNPAFTRVNTRFGIQKNNLILELFVKNLFDDNHWDYAYKLTDLSFSPLTSFTRQGVAVYAPDRREVGLRMQYKF